MTTEELLWNATFEQENQNCDTTYNYNEEKEIERYYEDKELFERYGKFFKTAS